MLLHLCVLLYTTYVGALPSWIDTSVVRAMGDDEPEEIGSEGFWFKIGISALFIVLGGFFAGLTIGLMGLDPLHLQVLASSADDPSEKANAMKVLKLMRKGKHWVLVVLLLGNVIVNESLPIFLDSAIGGGVAAILISTAMIVIFGIIPQAVCARYGLVIGAKSAPLVLCLMYLFSPIAYPIAKLLDYVLGVEGPTTYKKAELRSFLQFHRNPNVHEKGKPLSFIGFLLIKRLLLYDPSTPKKVSELRLTVLPEARPSISCFQALDYFQTGRSHLLLISSTPGIPGGALGVVTLEDIIEEIISEEIVDETDVYEDMQTKQRAKRQGTASVMKGIVERTQRVQRRESVNSMLPSQDTSASNHMVPSAPGTPMLGPTVVKGGVGESTRLLTPIDESMSNGDRKTGGKRPDANGEGKPIIVVEGQRVQNGYGATD
ncbi:hypothetical protein FRB97_005777 [Tulasnella sp. 331]|nr:hypothetical protein FRB97_005777 [Tulasnella sp. 331]